MESDLNRIQLGQIESMNRWRLNQDSPDIAHQLGHQTQEARRADSVDNTMVPAKAQRLNETGLKRGSIPLRLHLRPYHTQDRNLGRIDDRCKVCATYPT